ncbi:Chaperone protein DnaJ [Vitis vinifera]|uniref:Chaperone protein DnaJ n=1 Tax=Vitis vinifera TaxID=29760 RepID=A0A438I5S8_VITVI|nr:Chaperone protein DnaJ [Vitis vinifera]
MQVSVCPTCGGDGEVISEYCRKCSGEGRIRVKKDIKVKVPPGVSKGSILRVAGEGDAGLRGALGGSISIHSMVEFSSDEEKEHEDLMGVETGEEDVAFLGSWTTKIQNVGGSNEKLKGGKIFRIGIMGARGAIVVLALFGSSLGCIEQHPEDLNGGKAPSPHGFPWLLQFSWDFVKDEVSAFNGVIVSLLLFEAPYGQGEGRAWALDAFPSLKGLSLKSGV